jgi:hypothetical protein
VIEIELKTRKKIWKSSWKIYSNNIRTIKYWRENYGIYDNTF